LEVDHRRDRGHRLEVLHFDLALEPHQLLVDGFERREVKPILAAEIVVDHPLVDLTATGNVVGAGVGEAMPAELDQGRAQDLRARAVGIARPGAAAGGAPTLGRLSLIHASKMPARRARRNVPDCSAAVDSAEPGALTRELIRASAHAAPERPEEWTSRT